MKKKEINDLVGFAICEEIVFGNRSGSGRLPFKEAKFCNGKSLSKRDFGKFCRLLRMGQLNVAKAFILNDSEFAKLSTERRRRASSAGGRAAMRNPKNHVQNRIFKHWNKGSVGLVKAWNKGLTKITDERCKNISDSKLGPKNPMFGRPVSSETRAKISAKTKNNILSGRWTPNTFNSRTRKTLLYDGILFRSSWEALFHQAFPKAKYETLRIPYETDKPRVYITDFVLGKTVFEIKPQKQIALKSSVLEKINEWCGQNGYDFVIVDEFHLVDLIPEISVRFEEFDPNTQKLIRGLYASVAKRRNRETKNRV